MWYRVYSILKADSVFMSLWSLHSVEHHHQHKQERNNVYLPLSAHHAWASWQSSLCKPTYMQPFWDLYQKGVAWPTFRGVDECSSAPISIMNYHHRHRLVYISAWIMHEHIGGSCFVIDCQSSNAEFKISHQSNAAEESSRWTADALPEWLDLKRNATNLGSEIQAHWWCSLMWRASWNLSWLSQLVVWCLIPLSCRLLNDPIHHRHLTLKLLTMTTSHSIHQQHRNVGQRLCLVVSFDSLLMP